MLEFESESGIKQRNKEWYVKTYIHQSMYKSAYKKYLSSIASTACHFRILKCYQKLKFDNPFRIQFTNQEMAFRLCTKQSVGGNSHE